MLKRIRKKIKKYKAFTLLAHLKLAIVIYISFAVTIFILDTINIKQYLPVIITEEYDVLAFWGSIASGIAMIVVSIVATSQEDRLIAEQAILSKSHKIVYKITQRIEGNKLKLKITEPDGIALTKMSVKSVKICKIKNARTVGNPIEIYIGDGEYHDLEYTDSGMDKDGAEDSQDGSDFYYIWVEIDASELHKDEFFKEGGFYRFDIDMRVQNLFGVEISYISKLIVKYKQSYESINNEPSALMERYHTFGYYKGVKYIN